MKKYNKECGSIDFKQNKRNKPFLGRKSWIKTILFPLVMLKRARDRYLCIHNPEKLFCMRYKRVTGNRLNVNNPSTLYEKIAYMAFRTDTTEWSRLADKVHVRDYVNDCGLGECLPKLLGVWEKASDVDFDKLPNSFVIKTNNASATNILVRNKSELDINSTRQRLEKWLKWEYGLQTCQPHYSRIKPLILAEEFLVDNDTAKAKKSLVDYKFYCINGIPLYVMVMTDREPNTHKVKVVIFDMSWNAHNEFVSEIHETADETIQQPSSFTLMQQMASTLSKPFPFVRVDFYEVNGKPVFGEMTFTPGFDTFTQAFQVELGKACRL